MSSKTLAFFLILSFLSGCKNLVSPKILNERSFYSPGLEVFPGETYYVSNLDGALCMTLVNVSHSQMFSSSPADLGLQEACRFFDGTSDGATNSEIAAEPEEQFLQGEVGECGTPQIREFLSRPPKSLLECCREQLQEDEIGFRSNYYTSPRADNFKVGDARNLWASCGERIRGYEPADDPGDAYYGMENNFFKQIPATCRAVSKHAAVFVADDEFSGDEDKPKIVANDFAIADQIASAVDDFFDAEVSLLGNPFFYESTGGLSKLVVFIYDIADSGVIGYFSPKDYYKRTVTKYTNLLEMFCIDAHYAAEKIDVVFSTLIHEFQHMILFYQKQVKGRVWGIDTWFNEMLSLMAEDIIYPHFKMRREDKFDDKTDAGWMPNFRGVDFLKWYSKVGVTYEEGAKSYTYYPILGIFGSYLLRNYGGAKLLHELVNNEYQGEEAVGRALGAVYPKRYSNLQGAFDDVLTRFPEIFLTQTAGAPIEFCSVRESIVSSFGGISYTLYGFDLWDNARWRNLSSGFDQNAPQLFEGSGKITIPSRCFQMLVLLDEGHRGKSFAVQIPNLTGDYGNGRLRCFLYCAEQPQVIGQGKKKQWNK